MTSCQWIVIIIFGALCISACSAQVAALPTKNEQQPRQIVEPRAVANTPSSPLLTPPLIPITEHLTSVMTATVVDPSAMTSAPEGWLTYTDPQGFTLEYPADWVIYRPIGGIAIRTPMTATKIQPEGVSINFGHYQSERKDQLHPDYGLPNEGGMQPYWLTPLTIGDGMGWMYVWGNYEKHDPEGALVFSLYHESYKTAVTFHGPRFTSEDVKLASRIGLEATVKQQYPRHEHIVRSFRFLPPEATPTSLP